MDEKQENSSVICISISEILVSYCLSLVKAVYVDTESALIKKVNVA